MAPDPNHVSVSTPLLRNSHGLNTSPNVLVLYRLQDLQRVANVNLWLAFVCLFCCGVYSVLLYLNYVMNQAHPPSITHKTFHVIEFWTTCIYAVTEAHALVTTPKTMLTIYQNPTRLKLLLFFNVVAALIPAVLVTLDLTSFEHLAHEIEFLNEIGISFVTMVLLLSLLRKQQTEPKALGIGILSIAIACTTFLTYNFGSEENAHYFEFVFSLATALITFWFCMDNRFVAEMEIGQILFGQHDTSCGFCQSQVLEFTTRRKSATVQWNYFPRGPPNSDDTQNDWQDDQSSMRII
jgi:hypothetical protein